MPDTSSLVRRTGVELVRTGSWQISSGTWTPSVEDIASAIAAMDCPGIRNPVIKLGHLDPRFADSTIGGDGQPALGWYESLRSADGGHTLVADQVALPWLTDVQAAAYPDRSVEGNYNHRCQLGHVHPFVITAVALLGVTPPGVGTLRSLQDLPEYLGIAAAGGTPEGARPVQVTIRAGRHSFVEDEHPRAFDGKFADLPGGGGDRTARHHQADSAPAAGSSGHAATPTAKTAHVPLAVDPQNDKLKLASRIKLSPGEHLVASGQVKSSESGNLAVMAVVDTKSGSHLRFGVVDNEHARKWSAADKGGTAQLDAAGIKDLQRALANLKADSTALKRQYHDAVRKHYADEVKNTQPLIDRLRELSNSPSSPENAAEKNRVRAELDQLKQEFNQSGPDWEEMFTTGAVKGSSWGDIVYQVSLQESGGYVPTTDFAEVDPQIAIAVRPANASSDWKFSDATGKEEHLVMNGGALAGLGKQLKAMSATVEGGQVKAAAGDTGGTGATQTGAMVALIPTDEDAQRLTVEGGEPVDQLHVTLAYLGDAVDLDAQARQNIIVAVSSTADGMAAVEADGFALSMFNPPGAQGDGGMQRDSCVVLGLSGEDIDEAHDAIEAALAGMSLPVQHAPWAAHLTLQYTADPGRVAALIDRAGPVVFDRLRIAFAGQVIDIPLITDDDAFGPDDSPDIGEEPQQPGDMPMLAAAEMVGDNVLKQYWTAGPGLAKWRDKRHPWTALYRHLAHHVDPERAKRIAATWFHDVTGTWPGSKSRSKVAAATEGSAVPKLAADKVRTAWNNSGAPVTQWIVEARANEVIVCNEPDRSFTRIPVLASGDVITFGEPVPYDPETERALVFASRAASRPDTKDTSGVSDKPWSKVSQGDYTPEQWRKACLVDMGTGDPASKDRYKLPVREPDGTLNRNAVHAAAGGHGISAVKGIDDKARQAAAKTLVGLYRNDLDEQPPFALLKAAGVMASTATEEPPAAEPVQPNTEEDTLSTLNADVRQRLGLADDVDDAGILAAVDALKLKAETPTPTPDDAAAIAAAAAAKEAEQKVAAAAAENASLTQRLAALELKVPMLTEQLEQATAELAATRAAKEADVKASVLDGAQRQGKFRPADRDKWAAHYDTAPGVTADVLASMAVGSAVPVLASGVVGDGEPSSDEGDPFAHLFSEPLTTKGA